MAVNEITNHKVAIKILNKRKIKMQGVFEKVKREIKVLRRFNHPHIIKHFEFIDTSSDIFIVLEYAEKGELFDLIQRKEKVSFYSLQNDRHNLQIKYPPDTNRMIINTFACFLQFLVGWIWGKKDFPANYLRHRVLSSP